MKSVLPRQSFWFKIAIFNFFVAACIGTLLRFAFVEEVAWLDYRNFMQAHANLAILGWIYLGLFILLIRTFLDQETANKRIYHILFILTEICILGVWLSFLINGYGLVSLFFLGVISILIYVFCWHFYKDFTQKKEIPIFSQWLIKAALGFLVISTFGIWAMGGIILGGMKGSISYYLSIQFFYHFQFNGWVIFTILGLLFSVFSKRNLTIDKKLFQRFFIFLTLSCFLTFALAVAWGNPEDYIFWINSIGAVVQLIATGYLIKISYQANNLMANHFNPLEFIFITNGFCILPGKNCYSIGGNHSVFCYHCLYH